MIGQKRPDRNLKTAVGWVPAGPAVLKAPDTSGKSLEEILISQADIFDI